MGAGASKVSSGTVTVKLPTGAMIETTPTTDEAFASLTTGEVFGWLSSSPKIGTPCKMSLDKHFPGSLPGSAVKSKTASILYEKYGCVAKNTLYGQSICSDEINNEKGDLADLMKEYWGEVFPLGGIGGAPFVGKTGFMAFSHHVPDDGNVLILFGPHVGVTEDGEVGKYHRIGQKGNSTSCGAVIAAYQQCCGTTEMPFDMDDMQQSWLRQYIGKDASRTPLPPPPRTPHPAPPLPLLCRPEGAVLQVVRRADQGGDRRRVRLHQGEAAAHRQHQVRQREAHPYRRHPDQPAEAVRGPLPAQILPGARRGLRARRPPPRARAAGAEEGLRRRWTLPRLHFSDAS